MHLQKIPFENKSSLHFDNLLKQNNKIYANLIADFFKGEITHK